MSSQWQSFLDWLFNVAKQNPPIPGQRQASSTFDPSASNPLIQEKVGWIAQIVGNTYLNVATNDLEIQRTPTLWKLSGFITAQGRTTIWNPQTDKKFRLMGASIVIPIGSTTGATQTIGLQDASTDIFVAPICVGALAATTVPIIIPVNFPQNGYLSKAQNNTLGVNLATAFTAGNVYLNLWGNEE